MRITTWLLLGAAGYYLYRQGQQAVAAASPTAATQASTAAIAKASTDVAQQGATSVAPTVVVVQPDDHYDMYQPGGWGPSWGVLVGGGRGHGGHGGHGHGGGHGGHH